MSNYQARSRAIRAERAAERCAELYERIWQECKRHERMHYEETRLEFEQKHAMIIAQMEGIQKCLLESALFVNKPIILKDKNV